MQTEPVCDGFYYQEIQIVWFSTDETAFAQQKYYGKMWTICILVGFAMNFP